MAEPMFKEIQKLIAFLAIGLFLVGTCVQQQRNAEKRFLQDVLERDVFNRDSVDSARSVEGKKAWMEYQRRRYTKPDTSLP